MNFNTKAIAHANGFSVNTPLTPKIEIANIVATPVINAVANVTVSFAGQPSGILAKFEAPITANITINEAKASFTKTLIVCVSSNLNISVIMMCLFWSLVAKLYPQT